MLDRQYKRAIDLGFRLVGIVLAIVSWLSIRAVFAMHIPGSATPPALAEYALAAAGFVCGGSGAVLTVLGHHIFDEMDVSERWRRLSAIERPVEEAERSAPTTADWSNQRRSTAQKDYR